MAKRTFVLSNPKAGTAAKVREMLDKLAGLTGFSVHQTEAPGDGVRLARQAVEEGYARLIVMGGDGTVNEALNGVAPDFGKIEFGIAPFGTGNDFATMIGIPDEPEEAVECLLTAETAMIDVGLLEAGETRRYFINASAGGFSSKVTEHLDSERKSSWGGLAFYISAAEALPELEAHQLKVRIDDSETIETECLNLVVANGRTVAGGIPVAPLAEPDDGLLDLLILPIVPTAELAALFRELIAREEADHSSLLRSARKIEIVCDPPMVLNIDGEIAADTPAQYSVLPQALRTLVAPDWVRARTRQPEAAKARMLQLGESPAV